MGDGHTVGFLAEDVERVVRESGHTRQASRNCPVERNGFIILIDFSLKRLNHVDGYSYRCLDIRRDKTRRIFCIDLISEQTFTVGFGVNITCFVGFAYFHGTPVDIEPYGSFIGCRQLP